MGSIPQGSITLGHSILQFSQGHFGNEQVLDTFSTNSFRELNPAPHQENADVGIEQVRQGIQSRSSGSRSGFSVRALRMEAASSSAVPSPSHVPKEAQNRSVRSLTKLSSGS